LREFNSKRPQDQRIQIRIGVHLGDVVHRGADVLGDAVNVASRIEALAPPGGICVTAQVYASVANRLNFGFESLGTPLPRRSRYSGSPGLDHLQARSRL
jgi:class 3 adenylate cyclase